MKVTIELPDKVWGKLTALADADDVKVQDMLGAVVGDTISNMVRKRQRYKDCRPAEAPAVRVRIVELMARHYPASAIGRQLGISSEVVRATLSDMGLPARTRDLM